MCILWIEFVHPTKPAPGTEFLISDNLTQNTYQDRISKPNRISISGITINDTISYWLRPG